MKLRVRDRKVLERILENLQRGQAHLMQENTLVCMRKDRATTSLDFSNAMGEHCTSINKEIGSLLALLHTGIDQLANALKEES